ncbi:uncharacterized protein [Littorina saxatilis]|uniref:Reverse transcriptase n=1 Tax=Littorina saxatilis TaxID=31220 RepID=A0AAN9BX85_9CAEN
MNADPQNQNTAEAVVSDVEGGDTYVNTQGESSDNDSQTLGARVTTYVSAASNERAGPIHPVKSGLEWTRELLAIGRELGLEGKDLREFVAEERAREEREAHEREREREERAREEREREREVLEREREADRAFQLEQLRIQTEARRDNANNNASRRRGDDDFIPKIPFLDDKDDIESWFAQFEHYATDCHLDDERKATRMVYFLKGKARTIYAKLSFEDARNYNTLKNALYDGFQLTADQYRKKFRQLKRNPSDTYKEHVTKLERILDKWIELAKCDEHVADLKDLVLREQLENTFPAEVMLHVLDRKPKSAKEMGEIATEYEQSRSNIRPRQSHQNHSSGSAFSNTKSSNVVKSDAKEKSSQKEHKYVSDEEKQRLKATGCCFFCRGKGHTSRFCPNKGEGAHAVHVRNEFDEQEIPVHLDKLCKSCEKKDFKEEVFIKLDGRIVKALRDSGCSGIMVSADLIPEERYLAKKKETTLAEKKTRKLCPTAVAHIDCPYFDAKTEVVILEDPIYPVLIGKWYGVGQNKRKTPLFPVRDPSWYQGETNAAVSTRKQEKEEKERNEKPVPGTRHDDRNTHKMYSPQDLKKAQNDDETLAKVRQMAVSGESFHGVRYVYKKEILYRTTLDKTGSESSKVVVPKEMRTKVLSFGHDHPMAGHLGQKKTTDRIRCEFWWPGFVGDIKRYCLSCDTCQRTAPKGRTKKAPLGQMPTINPVFKRVAVDIIGPIKPMSESKKQYILTMVDYATRYPEAVALKDIRADTVAEALFEMWTRLGIPDEVITDQGTQFTSNLMKEVNQFLSIKHKMTTPFHPQANGLVERFNGTLKSMLRKLAIEQPVLWDTFIPALLFAYREAPQDSLGFSPFEMLYGKTIRGPMQVLRRAWTDESVEGEQKTTAEYVVDLRNRIEETCEIAKENLAKSSQKQAGYFNRKTALRSIEVGKKVLLLLPVKHNKLELTWRGPYVVTEKVNQFDYRVKVGTKQKVFHINLMKEYQERDIVTRDVAVVTPEEEEEEEAEEHIAVVIEEDDTMNDDIFQIDTQKMIPLLETTRTEDVTNMNFCKELSRERTKEAKAICSAFSKNLTDVPITTNLEKCRIELTEKKPVFVRPRPIPHAMVKTVEDEIDEMLKLGVIEPANSPYNAPIVLVKKKGGKYRFCCDLRELNKVTVFDAEPITDVDHLFQSLGKAKFFTKLDLTKGYWCIPIVEEDRDKTAFTTSRGQFRWANMPFGLKTATGIFNRMMRKLLGPLKRDDVFHFMDDILIATESWEEHMVALKAVLQRLQDASISAKPSKCYVGYSELPYLGHGIGGGKRWPEADKVDKIKSATPPSTKKELRSFLGLCGFYRSYINSYASIAIPLTDMTKKSQPDKLKWDERSRQSFEKLKEAICKTPVLCMPDHEKEFVLRTDASDRGIGAVLMQEQDKTLRPLAYQSKKLNGAESRYATVEKECLATVWGIQKFERYLYGRHFTLETDHQPLKCLQRQPTNPRLMRWALQLQPYDFTVRVIPGCDNHGADYLSRASYCD